MRQKAEAWELALQENAEASASSRKRKPEPHEEDGRLEVTLPSGEVVGSLFTMDEDENDDNEFCNN
eukprot:7546309-Heterocapsa_arctica.AAC.1